MVREWEKGVSTGDSSLLFRSWFWLPADCCSGEPECSGFRHHYQAECWDPQAQLNLCWQQQWARQDKESCKFVIPHNSSVFICSTFSFGLGGRELFLVVQPSGYYWLRLFPLQCFRTKTLLVITWLILVVGSFALSLLGVSYCFFFESLRESIVVFSFLTCNWFGDFFSQSA